MFGKKIPFWLLFVVLVCLILVPGAMAERLAVKGKVANIRSGPGTNYEVIWQAEQNYPIEVIQTQGDWILFKDYENDKGWISKGLTASTQTVIVKNPTVNVRAGASTSHPIVFKAQKGTPFKILKKEGQWYQIEHADGDKGWISSSVVW